MGDSGKPNTIARSSCFGGDPSSVLGALQNNVGGRRGWFAEASGTRPQ